jgi:hypothetical protein
LPEASAAKGVGKPAMLRFAAFDEGDRAGQHRPFTRKNAARELFKIERNAAFGPCLAVLEIGHSPAPGAVPPVSSWELHLFSSWSRFLFESRVAPFGKR